MNNINDVYLFANDLANKLYSGAISPDQFNRAIDVAQQEYMRIKVGLPEEFEITRREARQQFQATQDSSDELSPFINQVPLTISGTGFQQPADFVSYINADFLYVYVDANGNNVAETYPLEFVTIEERAIRLNSYIDYPTLEYPICTWINKTLVVNPTGINNINFYYIRRPITAFRAYTLTSNDQDQYDPTLSVQLEFNEIYWKSITAIVVDYWATFLRDTELKQAMAVMKGTGQ